MADIKTLDSKVVYENKWLRQKTKYNAAVETKAFTAWWKSRLRYYFTDRRRYGLHG